MSECHERAAGTLTYWRRIGGPGNPWVEWDREPLCEYHAYRHRKAAAPGQDSSKLGHAVLIGHLGPLDVHHLARWHPKHEEDELLDEMG